MTRRVAIEFVFVFMFSTFAAAAIATHVFAWIVGPYTPLGSPIWQIHAAPLFQSIPIFNPWLIAKWWWWWGTDTFGMHAAFYAGIITIAGFFTAWAFGVVKVNRPHRHERDFGKREWGTKADAKKAGLLADDLGGTILGQIDRDLLAYNGDEHQLIAGAAGSGKTSGPVLSSLLSWEHSVLVYDPKRELYAQSARHRSTLGRAVFFDPTSQDSAAFNPLWEIRVGTDHEIGDVQNIVSILIDPTGSKNSFEYWGTEAARLLTAIVLHMLHDTERDHWTLAEASRLLTGINVSSPKTEGSTLARMLTSKHHMVRDIASYFSSLPEKQLAGIHGSASACLILYDDKLVSEKTSRSDFVISDLVCSDEPMSLYIQVRPTDAVRLRPLTRLILTQVAQALMYDIRKASDGREKKHRLLYLLEEFPTLGRLDFFSTQMRVMRGYGITALLIVQSFKDIINAYGRDQTIVDNCRIVVAFAASDPDTLRMISTMVGTGVETKESESKPRAGFEWFKGSRSISKTRRALLDPGEVRMLGYDEQVVLVTGEKPLRTKKVRWFKHRWLKNRGTNLHKGQNEPTQDVETLRMIEDARALSSVETARPDLTESKPNIGSIREQISELADRMAWSGRKTAQMLFPSISDSTARGWLSGKYPFPPEASAFAERLLAITLTFSGSDEQLREWLITENIEKVRFMT